MANSILKKAQAFALVFSLVLFTTPGFVFAANRSDVPDAIYVQNGPAIFRVELGDMLRHIDDILYTKSGAATITLSRGIWPEDSSPDEHESSFFMTGILDAGEFVIQDREEISVSGGTTRSLSEISQWSEVVQLTIAATTDYLEYTWVIGRDTQSLRYPWALFGLDENDPESPLPDVVVILNGYVANVPFDLLSSISEAILESGIIPPQLDVSSVEDLVGHLNDHVKFAGNYAGFNLVLSTILERMGGSHPDGCGLTCIGCGIALIGYGVSLATLLASCATLTPICILGIIGHEVAGASLVLSCSSCFRCLKRDSLSNTTAGPAPVP